MALVHDYLTQRGGAERVVLALAAAFPGAPIHTSFYDRAATFPEFGDLDVRTLPIDRIGALRRRHRLALPLLALSFSALRVDAPVAICSSSGWAHGARVTGRKVVYCHNPARWLYQTSSYVAGLSPGARLAFAALRPALRSWDGRKAASANRYLVNSEVVRRRVTEAYGIEAEVLHPPVAFGPAGASRPLPGTEPGFYLCVSRLLGYKNVSAVVAAFADLPGERLIVIGTGPLARPLEEAATANVSFVGDVDDATLRWSYGACRALIAASYEDFGLTPVEAASFGKPAIVLRWGGFLETVVEGETGVFFEEPTPASITAAVGVARQSDWDPGRLRDHADCFSPLRFTARLEEVIAEELSEL